MKQGQNVYAHGVESDNTSSRSYVNCEVISGAVTGRRSELSSDIIARFWSKVQRSDGCWLWTAGRFKRGYGQFNTGRRPDGGQQTRYAHRVAYELTHGPVPPGLVVRHKCDVPLCCNPDHLELGTQRDNIHDSVIRGRQAKERPGRWAIEPALRRRLIDEALAGPRGTVKRLAREHNLKFYSFAVAVIRARHRREQEAV